MRLSFLFLFPLLACDTTKDTDSGAGSDGSLPGLDTDDWVFAAEMPEPGAGIQHRFLVGGLGGDTAEAHWTDVYTVASSGEVLCAYTTLFTGTETAADSGCAAAWGGYFGLLSGYEADLCTELLGYDPLGKDLNHLVGLGYDTDGTLCLLEDGYGWDEIAGARYEAVGADGFLLTFEESFFYKE